MVFDLFSITRDNVLAIFGLQRYSHLFIFEIIDMLIMALAIGYIFSDVLKKPANDDYDPLKHYKRKTVLWENVKYAALAAGPAIVLHELSHKFVAMSFGAQAILYAPYGWYILIALLKMINFPLIFFVGGMVIHTALPPLQSALVALAGPLMNFLTWIILTLLMKKKKLSGKYIHFFIPLSKISLFLAIFNMIPIPGFDGFDFFSNLIRFFFRN
jgi:Zn-dependent protease